MGILWSSVFAVVIPLAAVTLLLLLVTAAVRSRRDPAGAAERACPRGCDLLHPPEAKFCRRCGGPLG
jgi:hypothetical protein